MIYDCYKDMHLSGDRAFPLKGTQIYAQITNDKIGQDMTALSGEIQPCFQGRAAT